MDILVPDGSGTWVDGRAYTVAGKLRHGDPALGLPPCPDLELHWFPGSERPARKACWIVKRWCEDGQLRALARWDPEEIESIPFCLTQMRLDSPGHEDVCDRIDRHNAEVEDHWSRRAKDAMGEMFEHALKLHHDRNEPRNVFRQVGGRRDAGH